jgi:hypothetical protein
MPSNVRIPAEPIDGGFRCLLPGVLPIHYVARVGFLRRNVEGVPARALVVEYWQGRATPDVSFGESKSVITRFTAIVQVEGQTAPCEVSGRLKFWVGWSIVEGDIIPVLLDRPGGRPIGFAKDELEREMTPRLGLYEQEAKRRSSVRYLLREEGLSTEELRNAKESAKALAKLPGQWKRAVFERPAPGGGLAADDPSLEPIEGVDFDTWVAVQAALVRERIPKNAYDEVAQRHGVPPGRWSAVEAAWRGRMKGNPGLAQRFGESYQAALRT